MTLYCLYCCLYLFFNLYMIHVQGTALYSSSKIWRYTRELSKTICNVRLEPLRVNINVRRYSIFRPFGRNITFCLLRVHYNNLVCSAAIARERKKKTISPARVHRFYYPFGPGIRAEAQDCVFLVKPTYIQSYKLCCSVPSSSARERINATVKDNTVIVTF